MKKPKGRMVKINIDEADKRKAIFKILRVWENIDKLGSEDFDNKLKLMLQEYLRSAYSITIGIGTIELLNMSPWDDKSISIVANGIESLLTKA